MPDSADECPKCAVVERKKKKVTKHSHTHVRQRGQSPEIPRDISYKHSNGASTPFEWVKDRVCRVNKGGQWDFTGALSQFTRIGFGDVAAYNCNEAKTQSREEKALKAEGQNDY